MLAHLQAAENPGVNIREGEWHAAEKRGQHTGVSEHFAPGPMEKWCLRDKAEAYNPCRAPQGPLLQCLLSFYLAFPFLSCTASQPEQEVRDGDLAESLLRSVLLWWICRFSATEGLDQPQILDVSHLTVKCSQANCINSVQMSINTYSGNCCNTFPTWMLMLAVRFSFGSTIINQSNSITVEVDLCSKVC